MAKVRNAHYQVTNIHQDQSFENDRLYCERYNVWLEDDEQKASNEKDKALKCLRKSAENIIPASEMKNVVFSSIDTIGKRCFAWMYGNDDWINQTGKFDWRKGYYVTKNRQVYKN